MMNINNLDLWSKITFKTQSYRKNFDLAVENENIITEYDGIITEVRISQHKLPLIIGEYGFSIWNIGLGKMFDININKLIKKYAVEDTYLELYTQIKNKKININSYNKLILIHTLILHPKYRKREITEEFIEFIYREYYDEKNAIIVLVKPFQDNIIDAEYYLKHKYVQIKDNINDFSDVKNVTAKEYYELNNLMKKNDSELNEYKLFSIASNCGFSRIDDSHLFVFSPEKTIKRMNEKHNLIIKQNV